ncbi:hypothetical protein Dsin_005959 [Dipteronia sinensis]|uniref:Uncharacterized protein n=1 Tax=Dipteronia sinensis TaxID=43782 RepID=A0AAE0AXU3_9ROSI|nr:hypothetical protein Dsin_005959 [Dipteronia sinensis]
MAPLVYLSFRKVLLIYLVASAFFLSAFSQTINDHHQLLLQSRNQILGGSRRRSMLADFEEEQEQKPNKPKNKPKNNTTTAADAATSSSSNKNKTKLIKPNLSTTTKNQTKPLKTTTNSTKTTKTLDSLSKKSELIIKKLNSTTSKSISKPSSSKNSTNTKTKSSSDPLNIIKIKPSSSSSSLKNKPTSQNTKPPPKTQKKTTQQKPSWLDDDGDEEQDFVSEIRDLPIKFHQTLLPDLETISTTSKAYINKYNKEITKKYFNPIVGNKYASTIASIVSFAFILIPLLLVSLVFNHFKAYFSLQKIIIFVQVYLSIYFTILCLSSMVTGLEPLKFLYATSRSTYVCLQVLQTLGYVLYLLMLLMYLVLVFSTDCGLGLRVLGLAQIFVGFTIGLHYYVAVFHRVVLRQPPKTNWKVHGIYATCFLVICLFNRAERRKKAYLEDGGEEGKKS